MNYAEIHFEGFPQNSAPPSLSSATMPPRVNSSKDFDFSANKNLEQDQSNFHVESTLNDSQDSQDSKNSNSTTNIFQLEHKLLKDKKALKDLKKVKLIKNILGFTLSHSLLFLLGMEFNSNETTIKSQTSTNEVIPHKTISLRLKFYGHFQTQDQFVIVDLYNSKKELVAKNIKIMKPKKISLYDEYDESDDMSQGEVISPSHDSPQGSNKSNDESLLRAPQLKIQFYTVAMDQSQVSRLIPYLDRYLLAFPSGLNLQFRSDQMKGSNKNEPSQKKSIFPSKNNSSRLPHSSLQQEWVY